MRGVENYDHGSERERERDIYDGSVGLLLCAPAGFFQIRKAPSGMFRQSIRKRGQNLD